MYLILCRRITLWRLRCRDFRSYAVFRCCCLCRFPHDRLSLRDIFLVNPDRFRLRCQKCCLLLPGFSSFKRFFEGSSTGHFLHGDLLVRFFCCGLLHGHLMHSRYLDLIKIAGGHSGLFHNRNLLCILFINDLMNIFPSSHRLCLLLFQGSVHHNTADFFLSAGNGV